jgi:hypothetical protein
MANTIFFAWQMDSPSADNKKFICDALCTAIGLAHGGQTAEEAQRPESDTRGLSGAPNVVEAIFSKIRSCSVFVADVTLTGTTPQEKRVPNPNVLIELGYAARSVGWDRVVLVLNGEASDPEDLPFDIRQHRWPIRYRVTPQTTARDARQAELVKDLTVALQSCASATLLRAEAMAGKLDTACLDFIAKNETESLIPPPVAPKQMGQLLLSLDHTMVIRRLMEIGALRVSTTVPFGYVWTYDGQMMIQHLNSKLPALVAGTSQAGCITLAI